MSEYICPMCGGTGTKVFTNSYGLSSEQCPMCKGKGKIFKREDNDEDIFPSTIPNKNAIMFSSEKAHIEKKKKCKKCAQKKEKKKKEREMPEITGYA
ncbi:MAG: hypothetical protein QXT63_04120 [Thermoplasmata archaeon]